MLTVIFCNSQVPRGATFIEPTSVAVHLMRQLRGEILAEICLQYGLKAQGSASRSVERVRGQMIKDRRFGKRADKLRRMIAKRQTET